MLNLLENNDPQLGKLTNILYEITIDYGAHPNPNAFFTNMSYKTEVDDSQTSQIHYISGYGPGLELCVKTVSRIGICSLEVFKLIYAERFALLGITVNLNRLKKGL